jgi:cytosine/uracil/thiamine/allantoin permease
MRNFQLQSATEKDHKKLEKNPLGLICYFLFWVTKQIIFVQNSNIFWRLPRFLSQKNYFCSKYVTFFGVCLVFEPK